MLGVHTLEVEHSVDAHRAQPLAHATAHTPDLTHLVAFHPAVLLGMAQDGDVAHPLKRGVLFGQMVGEFGQRFGGPNAHADGQTHPLGNPLPDLLPYVTTSPRLMTCMPSRLRNDSSML